MSSSLSISFIKICYQIMSNNVDMSYFILNLFSLSVLISEPLFLTAKSHFGQGELNRYAPSAGFDPFQSTQARRVSSKYLNSNIQDYYKNFSIPD